MNDDPPIPRRRLPGHASAFAQPFMLVHRAPAEHRPALDSNAAHDAPRAPARTPASGPPAHELALLRASLVAAWLGTAAVSAWEAHGQAAALLAAAGVRSTTLAATLVWTGAACDLAIGLWLWLRPGRAAYGTALAAMAGMTLVATALLPSLWLHPLGPLLKNLPIAATLVALRRGSR